MINTTVHIEPDDYAELANAKASGWVPRWRREIEKEERALQLWRELQRNNLTSD